MNVLNLVTTADSAHYQEQLRMLRRRGIDFDVVSSYESAIDGSTAENGRLSGSIGSSLYYGITGGAFYRRVLQHVRENDYDLVHATSGLVAPFALAQPIRPVVLSFWGSDVLGEYLFGRYGELCRLYSRMGDAVTVPSQCVKAKLGDNAIVIPHGVDLDRFKPLDQDQCRSTLGWTGGTKHVLFPYDPDRSVKRYELANEVVRVANASIEDPIELHAVSSEPHARMPVYMNAADALLVTSKHESQPLTVKEALACNLPVVSLDVGDVRRYLGGVEPSAVCDSPLALPSRLVEVLGQERRSNGRHKRREELQFSTMANRVIEVYESVLDGDGPESPHRDPEEQACIPSIK